jgi:hypothetical protein
MINHNKMSLNLSESRFQEVLVPFKVFDVTYCFLVTHHFIDICLKSWKHWFLLSISFISLNRLITCDHYSVIKCKVSFFVLNTGYEQDQNTHYEVAEVSYDFDQDPEVLQALDIEKGKFIIAHMFEICYHCG